MIQLTASLLTTLGENFYLVVIACVELVLAVILLFRFRRTKSGGSSFPTAGDSLTAGLNCQRDQVFLALRRGDLMPVGVLGDLPAMVGVNLDDLRDDVESLLSHMKDPQAGRRFWAEYRTWDGAEPLTTQLETAEGQWLCVSVYGDPERQQDLFVFRRATKEHQQEESYRESLQQAESASQFKSSFLFRMSHEIRTPMNGIAGMLTLAENRLAPDHPAMQYLTRANELSDHLLSLINDILDMSRIEAGKVELEKAPFSLRAFGGKLYDMFCKTLENKGVQYSVDFEELTVDWVIGDELRIGQVIINFLSNAVKFTEKGEVKVTIRQMYLKNGILDIMVRVHDTGIGMNPEFISRIFRPFEQEDSSTTRRFGGTGLGMAISDQLVKIMGGQIVVESLPGKGSDFSVILSLPVAKPDQIPAAAGKDQEGAAPQTAEARPCRILMAEDNEINAMIATEILTSKGAQVDVVTDGRRAVDRFFGQAPGYYDVILMDVQMPVMDGRTAARTIRSLDRPDAGRIPIFALSADAFVEDERLSRESGMNGHITKPIDFDALWQTIQKSLAPKEETK